MMAKPPRSSPTEEWRPVVGFEDIYQISNLGRVWSNPRIVDRKGVRQPRGGVFLKLRHNRHGYVVVDLSDRGSDTQRFVHVLVCEAFIGPQPSGHEVAHGDGVRDNNLLSNLRWATRLEQADDRRKHGTMLHGVRAKQSSLTDHDVTDIRRARIAGEKLRDLADRYGLTESSISRICSGASWPHLPFPNPQAEGKSDA